MLHIVLRRDYFNFQQLQSAQNGISNQKPACLSPAFKKPNVRGEARRGRPLRELSASCDQHGGEDGEFSGPSVLWLSKNIPFCLDRGLGGLLFEVFLHIDQLNLMPSLSQMKWSTMWSPCGALILRSTSPPMTVSGDQTRYSHDLMNSYAQWVDITGQWCVFCCLFYLYVYLLAKG